jgi:hypothetical protein
MIYVALGHDIRFCCAFSQSKKQLAEGSNGYSCGSEAPKFSQWRG